MTVVLSLWKGAVEVADDQTPRRARMVAVLGQVAAKHGVTPADIRGPSCVREIARARQEAMHELYALGWLSTPQVGRFLNRDHSTVVYGLKAHKARLAEHLEAQAA